MINPNALDLLILLLSIFNTYTGVHGEQAQDLELDRNVTEQRTHAMDLISLHLDHTGVPLGFISIFLALAMLKYCMTLPLLSLAGAPSILMLIFGMIMGPILSWIPDFHPFLAFNPNWFFCFFLPLIITDASWFLPPKAFFKNIGMISVYAGIGTLLSILITVGILILFSPLYADQEMEALPLTIFSVIISAVDPVAVISVFEELGVNLRLHLLVFGESLLNDGVVIVLNTCLSQILIASSDPDGAASFSSAIGFMFVKFWLVVGMGILFGLVFGICGVAVQRVTVSYQAHMPIFSFAVPYMCYLVTDTVGFSGLVANMTCCIIMKMFLRGNVCLEMQYSTEFIIKQMSSFSEAFVFIQLGYSALEIFKNGFDYAFVGVTIVATLVSRFIVIFLLTGIYNIINKRRHGDIERIPFRNQFIQAYGGLRGAVCYGLIASVDENVLPNKAAYVRATICVIIFTTVILGGSVPFMVKKLKVEKEEEKKHTRSYLEHTCNLTAKNIMAFMGELTKTHENFLFRCARKGEALIRDKLCYYKNPRYVDTIECQLMEDGYYPMATQSFAALPTDHSLAHLPTSRSDLFYHGYNEHDLRPPCAPLPSIPRPAAPPAIQVVIEKAPKSPRSPKSPKSPIPRNESASDIFFGLDHAGRRPSRGNRASIFNRHLLPYAAPERDEVALVERVNVEEEEEFGITNQLTFPYASSVRANMAQKAKNFSQSVKDKAGAVRSLSPHRAMTTKEHDPYKTFHGQTVSRSMRTGPPRFTIHDESDKPNSPPATAKSSKAKPERKITTGTKTFTVGGEDIELLPIHEDEDSPHSH